MREQLVNYPLEKVEVFLGYVDFLKLEKDKQGNQKNWWINNINSNELVNAFKKVAVTGHYIDGDTVTLTYRGKLVITYDYHAYQNKILMTYPDTIFDFGIVYEGQKYDFKKVNGKITYTHNIGDPFIRNRTITGAYGIIKNSKGEFLETIDVDDITKMKNSSKMAHIWNTWFDRMVLKSVIKRLCAVHFKDIVKDIDTEDNLQNDPDRAEIDENILIAIDEAQTDEQLTAIYNKNITVVKDRKQFISILTKRKKELKDGTLS